MKTKLSQLDQNNNHFLFIIIAVIIILKLFKIKNQSDD